MVSDTPDRYSLAALEAKVDALQRTQGYGIRLVPGKMPSPVEHIRDAPFETKELWVKQINQERLTDLGRAALGAAFTGFGDSPSEEEDKRHYCELMSARLEVPFEVDSRVMRRWAGDQTLPRGRYYALCDQYGNDQGTLLGELRTYYTPEHVGIVQIYDCTVPEDLDAVRRLFEIPVTDPHLLLFSFPPINGNANPFVKTFSDLAGHKELMSLFASTMLKVGLPLTVHKIRRERVLDLREPGSAKWLATTLSTLEWRAGDQSTRCFPQRSSLRRFADLLPELLAQERGGGGTCVAAGLLLRYLGADGLIFPSARNDTGVMIESGKIVGHHGWNFVDYSGAPTPEFVAWIEKGNQWPTQVGFRPYADAPENDVPVWYPEVRVNEAPSGGWQIQGLRRRTNLRWRKQLMHYALDCSRGDLSEDGYGTLFTCPEVLEEHGHIDIAGTFSKLVFEAVMGLDKADEGLSAFGRELGEWTPLVESIVELVDKVHGPSREKWTNVRSVYIPYQARDAP